MQTYIVQAGDTLYGISKQFGIPFEEIMAENNLTTTVITPGQVLKIPTSETTTLYVVKKGDTLYSIANKYDTTVSDLMELNNLKTNVLSIGQQLRIPVHQDTSENYIVYTVKAGDTLYKIAQEYDTTVQAIKSSNQLSSDSLVIGQQLKIPVEGSSAPPVSNYQTYIVQSGDTLYKIALEFGMTVDELIEVNELENNNLVVGQVLRVKKQSLPDIPIGSECYGTGYVEPTFVTYTVKSGDNLYAIARKYNTSVENLKLLNGLTSDNLSIGQVLKIREVS